jgi:hypothetical protein
MKLHSALTAFVLGACALAVAPARADSWNWSLTGPNIHGSGTFQTAGNAATFEPITGISGTFNGGAITGMVPLDTDDAFFYDNLFRFAASPHFTESGIVFDTTSLGHVNVGFSGETGYYELHLAPPGSEDPYIENDNLAFTVTPLGVTPVPEPSTFVLMATGLLGLGWIARRNGRPG